MQIIKQLASLRQEFEKVELLLGFIAVAVLLLNLLGETEVVIVVVLVVVVVCLLLVSFWAVVDWATKRLTSQ